MLQSLDAQLVRWIQRICGGWWACVIYVSLSRYNGFLVVDKGDRSPNINNAKLHWDFIDPGEDHCGQAAPLRGQVFECVVQESSGEPPALGFIDHFQFRMDRPTVAHPSWCVVNGELTTLSPQTVGLFHNLSVTFVKKYGAKWKVNPTFYSLEW